MDPHEYAGPSRTLTVPVVATSALVACIALGVITPRLWSEPPAESSARPAHQAVQVTPARGTQWKRDRELGVERVVLASGVLTLRVARKKDDPRLVVMVPDGEIEDLGTVFSVSVTGGKTVEIQVDEGRVLFHRPGLPSLPLAAGSTFRPVPDPPQVSPTVVPQPASILSTDHAGAGRISTRKRRTAVAPSERANQATRVPDVDDLDENARKEDAAYLRILDLLRRGRADEARRDADAYLRNYPEGFRRIEVTNVVQKLAAGKSATEGR